MIASRWAKVSWVVTAVACCSIAAAQAADVLTQHNGNARIGANLQEAALSPDLLRAGRFGKLWDLYADGQIVAQPLYVSSLTVDTEANPAVPRVAGTFNTVIVATMHNTVYAYDADASKTGPDGHTVPLWATWLGPPRPGGKDIDMWSTNDPEWGILSTPVASEDKRTLYVVAWHDDGPQGLRYKLHALDLASGAERIAASVIGIPSTDPSQPCRAQSPFNPCMQKQRTALLLSNGILYVGFGGDGSRGALLAFDAGTLAQKAAWSPTPTGINGGIWQSGQGPAADVDGNIYLMTANGTFDADRNGSNYGNSFVKLRFDGEKLVVLDYFTPCNQAFLNDLDLDLGSAGPALIPDAPPRLISGGKEGILYVLSPDNMGKYFRSPTAPNCQSTNAGQQVTAFQPMNHDGQVHYGNIHGSPVFWKGPDSMQIYVWGENSALKAYRLQGGLLQDVDHAKQSTYRPPLGMPGGMLSLSANGSVHGSGILWASVPLNGDANRQRGVRGIVLALDAEDVTQTLWTSEQFADRDGLGLFAKFTPPTIAGGKLFVASYGDAEPLRTYFNDRPKDFPLRYYVAVYGTLPEPTPHEVVNQNQQDVTVARAATEPLALDPQACRVLDATSLDCTDALTRRTGRPSLFRVILPASQDFTGCALLRVTVAAKNAGLTNASGIGFWSSRALAGNQAPEDSGQFVPKASLAPIGAATLKDGGAATLFEFDGVVNCPAAGGDVSRLFKPYMQFIAPAEGRIYRNWDVASNYRIAPDTPGFDRSGDVLR